MRIIAVGDPHFKTDNAEEVNMFVDRLEKLAREREPDLIVILGDVLHTHERLHTLALNQAVDFIKRMREISPTVVMVGNHDYINNTQFLSGNHWMNCIKEMENVEVVDKVLHKHIKDYHLVFVPYVSPGRFEEALNSSEEDWRKATVIFAHQEFYGCKMGAIVSVEGDRWKEEYPPVISGHIHSKQTIQKNVYYCGSAMQNAFGESEENIIPILTWEKKNKPYKLEEVDLELPRKKIVYTDVESMEDFKLPETKDQVKITLSGGYEEFKAFKKTKKYKDILKTGTKVVFKQKKLTKKEKEDAKDEPEKCEETDFTKILAVLVGKEKNEYLYQIHELLVNGKEISEDDILFV